VFRTCRQQDFGVGPKPDHCHPGPKQVAAGMSLLLLLSLRLLTNPEHSRRRRFRCVRVSIPADQAPCAASVPVQGRPPHGFRRRNRQGSRHGRYHRANHHASCCPKTLSHGHAPAFQGRTPSRAVSCALSGRQGPLQVHTADIRAERAACQDRRACQSFILPSGCTRCYFDVRGYPLRLR
jgi:hypothetical protein